MGAYTDKDFDKDESIRNNIDKIENHEKKHSLNLIQLLLEKNKEIYNPISMLENFICN